MYKKKMKICFEYSSQKICNEKMEQRALPNGKAEPSKSVLTVSHMKWYISLPAPYLREDDAIYVLQETLHTLEGNAFRSAGGHLVKYRYVYLHS
jgi:hypothetical protein